MKVLHVISSLRHGGAEKLLVSLLPHLQKRGVALAVASLLDAVPLQPSLDRKGIPVFNLHHQGTIYSIGGIAQSCIALRKTIADVHPDIIHTHLYLPDILARLAAPRSSRFITTLHGIDPWWSTSRRWRSPIKTRLDRTSGSIRGVRYVSVSKQVAETAEAALCIPPSRHRVIHNGIDLDQFPWRGRSERTTSRPTIIQVGRFYQEKGHRTALQALALLKSTIPDIQLKLIGDGPLRADLEAEILRLGLSSSVFFLGVRDDVGKQLRDADVFWMPSEREGLPLACLEAMASGLPVIASAVGGLPELIQHGRSGFLIQPGAVYDLAKRTNELLADQALYHLFSREGRAHVENAFSLKTTADRYVQAYRDLLSGVWS